MTTLAPREKEIINTIAGGLQLMTNFEKGYILGIVESKTVKSRDKKDDENEEQES